MAGKKNVPIKYTVREFNSIKDSLVEYAKRYYPDTYKDFNEASFGSLMLDTVAYVGDIMSFYLDFQANECFLDTALEYQNVVKLSKQLGYKYRGRPTSQGEVCFYILCPSNDSGTAPDNDYMPILKRGSQFSSTAGNNYMLVEDVDFSHSNNEIVVAKVDSTNGTPTSYAVKAKGKVISGELNRESIEVGSYAKLRKIELTEGSAVSEVISVTDDMGNEYFEVEYLSQDVIYKEFVNPNDSDLELTPKVLKPVVVPRRFVVERELGKTFLQFGYGSESDITSDQIVDPANVLLNLHGKDYITDSSFDPYNFTNSDKLGVSPSDTTLEVVYRSNNSNSVNAPVGTITQVNDPIVRFKNAFDLSTSKMRNVIDSLESINETPILGDLQFVDSAALKQRALGSFYSQNRAVTAQDYKTLTYSLPPQYGAVKRANVVLDQDSFKRNLNMYIIVENTQGKLTTANDSIKQNIKTWISNYKMINDTIDILDARVVNLGIEFSVISEPDVNKMQVLRNCITVLEEEFKKVPEIGEPFHITKIYSILNKVPGVIDTSSVNVVQKTGTNYADIKFNISSSLSSDKRYINIPKNVIYEIKFPDNDIRGTVK